MTLLSDPFVVHALAAAAFSFVITYAIAIRKMQLDLREERRRRSHAIRLHAEIAQEEFYRATLRGDRHLVAVKEQT